MIAAGTTVKFMANSSGAWSPTAAGAYGTAGQVLTSQGSGAVPVWSDNGSGTVTSITAGTGLTGGTITSSGTIALDSTAVIAPTLLTTTGDIIYASAANTPARLGIGTSGQVLTVSGGVPTWAAAPTPLSGCTLSATPFTTALGSGAGATLTTNSVANTAVGYATLDAEASGDFNTALGHNALTAQNGTSNNTALGANVGAALTTGGNNTLVGYNAGCAITTAACNVAVGVNALTAATANGSTAVGFQAGQTATTGIITAVGFCALRSNTTGNRNTALGYNAGLSNISGLDNTFIGDSAGDVATGNSGTFVGSNAGGGVTTGASNTLIGRNAGSAITTGGSNTIVGAYAGTATLANNVVLADGAGNIKLQVNENGAVGIGTTPSYGTSGQILMSNGTGSAPTWTSSAGLLPNYGQFLSTVSQTNLDTTNGNAVTFNTTAGNRNVSVANGSQITAAAAGTYNLQISMQVQKTDAGTDEFLFWFKKNGTTIANSATNLTMDGNGDAQLASLNIIVDLAAGEYVEIWWYSVDVNVQLLAEPASSPVPAIPSVIATLTPVGA
jgi:hypothetical protein